MLQQRLAHEDGFVHHRCRQTVQLRQRVQLLLAIRGCSTSRSAALHTVQHATWLKDSKAHTATNIALPLTPLSAPQHSMTVLTCTQTAAAPKLDTRPTHVQTACKHSLFGDFIAGVKSMLHCISLYICFTAFQLCVDATHQHHCLYAAGCTASAGRRSSAAPGRLARTGAPWASGGLAGQAGPDSKPTIGTGATGQYPCG